jgi:hypothetical protein
MFCIPGRCQRVCDFSVLDNFLWCDWYMQFMQVILLVSYWSESVYSPNLYWGQDSTVKACIVHITVPSIVCVPWVLTKTLKLTQLCLVQKMSKKKVPLFPALRDHGFWAKGSARNPMMKNQTIEFPICIFWTFLICGNQICGLKLYVSYRNIKNKL